MAHSACIERSVIVRNEQGFYISGIMLVSSNGLVKVEWVNMQESPIGSYNPNNPADVNLLRFNVFFRECASASWTDPGRASQLTLLPARTNDDILLLAGEVIAEKLQDHTTDGCLRTSASNCPGWRPAICKTRIVP